jgi:hypothetical protein
MDMQQMFELLLANQKKAEANAAKQEEMLAEMNAKMDTNQTKMDDYHKKRMAISDDYHEGIMARLGKMEAKDFKVNSEEMQPVMEHLGAPEENAIVKLVRGLKTQCRFQKSTAGRRGEPKELTRGNCGPQRKLAVACRKVSCHAKVAWRNKYIVRKIRTHENCGPCNELAVTRISTTRRGNVAWL